MVRKLRAFRQRSNLTNFSTCDWDGNFKLRWFYLKYLTHIYQLYFNSNFFFYKNKYLGEKINFLGFLSFFFEFLPKISNFVNTDNCIGKISSNSIWIYPVFITKKFEVDKMYIFLMKNWEIQIKTCMIFLYRSSDRIYINVYIYIYIYIYMWILRTVYRAE